MATDDVRAASDAWEALLPEFRELGGRADNIVARCGRRGIGLFPIESSKPIRLRIPAWLLVPAQDIELRDGCLGVSDSSSLSPRARGFFERYQRELSWNAGVRDQLWQTQFQWSQLPQAIQRTLAQIGWIDDVGTRFAPPSDELCFRQYLTTRAMTYRDIPVLMPMLEFINHSGCGGVFEPGAEGGVTVAGMFEEEVLVNYNFDDGWGRTLFHGFFDATDHALSVAFEYQCPATQATSPGLRIRVDHFHDRHDELAGVKLPRVSVEGGTVRFSHLMLGHVKYPSLARAIFHHVTRCTPIETPDELFDLIQHYNRLQFLKFLRVSENPYGPLAAMLREAAYQQLTTLSSYWGTAALSAAGSSRASGPTYGS